MNWRSLIPGERQAYLLLDVYVHILYFCMQYAVYLHLCPCVTLCFRKMECKWRDKEKSAKGMGVKVRKNWGESWDWKEFLTGNRGKIFIIKMQRNKERGKGASAYFSEKRAAPHSFGNTFINIYFPLYLFILPHLFLPPFFLPSSSFLACLSPRDSLVASGEKGTEARNRGYQRQGKNERKFERTKDKKRVGT